MKYILDDEYKDRGMLHRYGLFASVKYIPTLLNQNPTSLQAFSIVEHADIEHYYYEPVDKNNIFGQINWTSKNGVSYKAKG